MLKSVRVWRVAGAVGVSLGLCAIAHAQSYNPYTGSGSDLQGELRDQPAAVMGLNLKVPFGMQSNARDVSSQPRLSLGISFTEPAFGYERAGNDFDFSMGLTFSGEQYVALNGRPIPAYMLASYLDEAEGKTGSNTGLLIVGGLVLAVGLGAVILEDTLRDCIDDLTNGPPGGCPD